LERSEGEPRRAGPVPRQRITVGERQEKQQRASRGEAQDEQRERVAALVVEELAERAERPQQDCRREDEQVAVDWLYPEFSW
jgi:hypothetical protein